jgi:hypothetical protein
MEANIKKILGEISRKSTREIFEDHVNEVIVDDENKSVTIMIDRKYALNQLSSKDNI